MPEDKEQRAFDRYETPGIVVPGASLLLGLWMLFPGEVHGLELKDVTLGALGIFAIAAFCVGHILQAPANIVVDFLWKRYGRPTDRMRRKGCGLADAQVDRIPERVKELLEIKISIDEDDTQWSPVIAQIASLIANAGKAGRLEKFNGNYGLFRGLTTTLFALAITALFKHAWAFAALAAAATWFTRIRMKRFSIHYARELWLQFLSLKDSEGVENVAAP